MKNFACGTGFNTARVGVKMYMLEKLRLRSDVSRYWFTNRVMNNWNRFGRHVAIAESLGNFKRRLDKCMDRDDWWVG